jgi:hypothetical protein
MLNIRTPIGCDSERAYIFSVIFEDWLGIDYRCIQHQRDDVHISVDGLPGSIRMPDSFFCNAEVDWLKHSSLPQLPLLQWQVESSLSERGVLGSQIPVIYGEERFRSVAHSSDISTPIDIFGSAFFMLSRYEEAILIDRDDYERFPSVASLAYKADFLDRPIVDEYVELLWEWLSHLWPGLTRKSRTSRILATCDLDSPFAMNGSIAQTLRRLGGDILKRGRPSLALNTLIAGLQVRRGRFERDPHRSAIEWIMDANEEAGNRVAFYVIPLITDQRLDGQEGLGSSRMRALLRSIHERGHEIGIHPGYNTFRDPQSFSESVVTLRRILKEEDIDQSVLGGRQHFLRWEMPTTARQWEDNGLDYDSTLGYADRPGFRCGTCREYSLYDVVARKVLRLRERPLIVMDSSLISDRYLGIQRDEEVADIFSKYKEKCLNVSGDFTFLWHNSGFGSTDFRNAYGLFLENLQ